MVNTGIISAEEFESITKSNQITIFDFSATWCGPCRMMAPVVEECADKNKDKYTFYQIDIDEAEELSRQLNIMYVPTFVIFKGGKELGRTSGYLPIEEFENFIKDSIEKTEN